MGAAESSTATVETTHSGPSGRVSYEEMIKKESWFGSPERTII